MNIETRARFSYQLEHRYSAPQGRVFLTGTQALVRILLDQARRDVKAGLNTAGLVSGYRGSPLGGLDLELWRAKAETKAADIRFIPGVNEELAATAILGSQQVESDPDREFTGVFAMWYGKGPGVDRAGDALKHGNAYGASPRGGVLVVAGDDHGCVSSSMPHQSDAAFLSWFMPVLSPSHVGEYLAFGEYGYALSRYSGMWVGFKAVSETVESAASVPLQDDRQFIVPDLKSYPGGLHYRWPDLPGPQIEERMQAKKEAVLAFAKANPIDRHIYQVKQARFGLVTSGKAHLDVMEALRLLGADKACCQNLGIDIYKVGMVWPLDRQGAFEFVGGKQEVLVVEEKRGIIESQLKEYFYDWDGDKPKVMVGKRDAAGQRLIPWTGELTPRQLVPLIAQRLHGVFPEAGFLRRAEKICATPVPSLEISGAVRMPFFCSGCPHNTSTLVPEGSRALSGIGCHAMAFWMDRKTTGIVQMGGEGVGFVAASKFTGNGHVFQNLGDGTWYHSGSLAIRQAVAAEANITYKILYNDAVAMTGGQPVDGPVSVISIAAQSHAEGVVAIVIVSDQPEDFRAKDFPKGTKIYHRRALDAVQRDLRTLKGVSVLIYAQTCATEKRRRRKRGMLEDPPKFAFINKAVCEGCGDCSITSNCLSVEPVKTEFGLKRQINQSNCNKDFSCVDGFCPSFVTVNGARRTPKANPALEYQVLAAGLPLPKLPSLRQPYNLLVTGVGGTGVVTVGALITMAAHLAGRGATVLDFTGFAQKFGPVLSFIRLAQCPEDITQVRIDQGAADGLIGCDIVVSTSPKASGTYQSSMRAVVNLAEMPTGDIVRDGDVSLKVDQRLDALTAVIGAGNLDVLDANALAERLLGQAVFANIILLGMGWQNGLVPVDLAALRQAIVLNNVAVKENLRAFDIGRLAAARPDVLIAGAAAHKEEPKTLAALIAARAVNLTAYQDQALAAVYEAQIARFKQAEAQCLGQNTLTKIAARNLHRLMAYKDEYEVARLFNTAEFKAELAQGFAAGFKLRYHLAPGFLPAALDSRGRPRKRSYGAWMGAVFKGLAWLKPLRGGRFDVFGYQTERRQERWLIHWYQGLLVDCADGLAPENAALWAELLDLPAKMRGYGPVKAKNVSGALAEAERLRAKIAAAPKLRQAV